MLHKSSTWMLPLQCISFAAPPVLRTVTFFVCRLLVRSDRPGAPAAATVTPRTRRCALPEGGRYSNESREQAVAARLAPFSLFMQFPHPMLVCNCLPRGRSTHCPLSLQQSLMRASQLAAQRRVLGFQPRRAGVRRRRLPPPAGPSAPVQRDKSTQLHATPCLHIVPTCTLSTVCSAKRGILRRVLNR